MPARTAGPSTASVPTMVPAVSMGTSTPVWIEQFSSPQRGNLKATDFKANRSFATGPELSKYRYVHFATHGYLDSERPNLSAIVLSLVDQKGQPQDGFLRAHEIFNLTFAR